MAFFQDPIEGINAAPFETEAAPTWKLCLHTTEGSSYGGARATYARNGYAPHLTVGPGGNEGQITAGQHLAWWSRATTLLDQPGGIRPNRDYVIQVEIVGFCDPEHDDSWLYIHNWPNWYEEGVAEVLNEVLDSLPIPRISSVHWVDYPASYGASASQRLTTAEFDAYAGILGHQHAPENLHGDPGNLGAFVATHLLTVSPDITLMALASTVPAGARPAQLVRVKGKAAIYAVTYTGAVHVKNPTHLTFLRAQGWASSNIRQISARQLADLRERE